MQRLLDDASKISGIKYDISSFADITQAIHVMQEEMHIAGTTSKEAGTTIQGSVNSMKSAWQNLLTGLANEGADLSQLMQNLVESIFGDGSDNNLGVFGNVLPVINTIINSFSNAIPVIIKELAAKMPQILEAGINLLQNLITGIKDTIPQLLPVVTEMVSQILIFVVENLSTIVDAGIQILLAVIQGIAESLPELIPAVVDAVLTIVDTLIDNIDLIIDAGIQLILGLAEGLIEALPRLIEKAPEIIQKLVDAIIRNFPKIVRAGGQLIGELATGLVGSLFKLLEKAPEIISTLVRGIKNGITEVKNVGKYLVEGIWEGIKNSTSWMMNKVKEFAGSILKGIKEKLGIHSPSVVLRDEVGKYMAEGIGVGFLNTMKDVSNKMANAIPTDFDTAVDMNIVNNSNLNKEVTNNLSIVNAFKQAIKEMKIELNDREVGNFVERRLVEAM